MFRFRGSTEATTGFGRQVVEALARSASRSSAFKTGRKQVFLFDTPESLESFHRALAEVLRETKIFTPQFDNLEWALNQTGSMLLVIHASTLHYMCSEDEQEFEDLLAQPRQVKTVLDQFRGVSGQYSSGNLHLVTA